MNYTQEVKEFLSLAIQAEERGDSNLSQAFLDSAEKAEKEGHRAWALACIGELD